MSTNNWLHAFLWPVLEGQTPPDNDPIVPLPILLPIRLNPNYASNRDVQGLANWLGHSPPELPPGETPANYEIEPRSLKIRWLSLTWPGAHTPINRFTIEGLFRRLTQGPDIEAMPIRAVWRRRPNAPPLANAPQATAPQATALQATALQATALQAQAPQAQATQAPAHQASGPQLSAPPVIADAAANVPPTVVSNAPSNLPSQADLSHGTNTGIEAVGEPDDSLLEEEVEDATTQPAKRGSLARGNAKSGRGRERTKKVTVQDEKEGGEGIWGEEEEVEETAQRGRKRRPSAKAQAILDAKQTKNTKEKSIKRNVKNDSDDDEENDESGPEVEQPKKKKRRTDKEVKIEQRDEDEDEEGVPSESGDVKPPQQKQRRSSRR